MKQKAVLVLFLVFSFSAYAEIDVNRDCASQYQPVLDSNDNDKIAGFMLEALVVSDKIYAEVLIPSLMANDVYAFKYSARFAKECLTSGLTIKKVVDKMLLLDDL